MAFYNTITQAEIDAVNQRLTKTDIDGNEYQTETAQQWYDRNVGLVGETKAIERFKKKASKVLGI